MSGVNYPYRYQYETVAASQTAQVLGGTGAAGDYLDRVVVTITTSGANGTVTILDNSTTVLVIPASTPIGVYSINLGIASSSGAWKVTTGSAATALGVGIFSA
jgi:hypothetical protein